ncbi:MAG TPA: response regulator [Actinomycetota bacterium]|jgi:CheY-like chemotaxis protein|nr:response regulator [Actinomycetota bacterium]
MTSGADRRILIVEDHPTMREAMRLVLEGEGFVIEEAADGEAALASIRMSPPDLLFLDLNIPGTTGTGVLEAVRADPGCTDVRVIVVTAAGEESRAEALRLGADEYFTKPFSPTALLQTVERVLAGGATQGA